MAVSPYYIMTKQTLGVFWPSILKVLVELILWDWPLLNELFGIVFSNSLWASIIKVKKIKKTTILPLNYSPRTILSF